MARKEGSTLPPHRPRGRASISMVACAVAWSRPGSPSIWRRPCSGRAGNLLFPTRSNAASRCRVIEIGENRPPTSTRLRRRGRRRSTRAGRGGPRSICSTRCRPYARRGAGEGGGGAAAAGGDARARWRRTAMSFAPRSRTRGHSSPGIELIRARWRARWRRCTPTTRRCARAAARGAGAPPGGAHRRIYGRGGSALAKFSADHLNSEALSRRGADEHAHGAALQQLRAAGDARGQVWRGAQEHELLKAMRWRATPPPSPPPPPCGYDDGAIAAPSGRRARARRRRAAARRPAAEAALAPAPGARRRARRGRPSRRASTRPLAVSAQAAAAQRIREDAAATSAAAAERRDEGSARRRRRSRLEDGARARDMLALGSICGSGCREWAPGARWGSAGRRGGIICSCEPVRPPARPPSRPPGHRRLRRPRLDALDCPRPRVTR